jgi:hypothetical protein
MNRIIRIALVGIAALTLATGALARGAPLVNYQNITIAAAGDKAPTLEQVRKAILSALATRGWVGQPVGDDKILATFTKGRHAASVTIAFSPTAYAITYADSQNLSYTSAGGSEKIHSTYNKWLQQLKSAIDNALRGI